ncbi:MAG: hypothetical protein GY714_29425 [Desulfobacterales bacterium]|nr:hypothetical protein [Desulfobacterales bacterium]
MKKTDIWYELFLNILNIDIPVFVRFDMFTGGGGFRFLPSKNCFYKEFYKTESEILKYSLIEKMVIPESYKQGPANFSNDLDIIHDSIKKCNGVNITFHEKDCGRPIQGRFLEISLK